MSRLIISCRKVARILSWSGASAIVVLSTVPAVDRPVTGGGSKLEHFVAFALVAATFTIGYRAALSRLVLSALIFCGAIELLQMPLPTRHARVSDFIIDFVASCVAVASILLVEMLVRARHRNRRSGQN